jgi:hypothetical protein
MSDDNEINNKINMSIENPQLQSLMEETLPKSNNKINLSAHGYSFNKPESIRREILCIAMKDHGVLSVLRRLNLMRNYTIKKEIITSDIEFVKNIFNQTDDEKN